MLMENIQLGEGNILEANRMFRGDGCLVDTQLGCQRRKPGLDPV